MLSELINKQTYTNWQIIRDCALVYFKFIIINGGSDDNVIVIRPRSQTNKEGLAMNHQKPKKQQRDHNQWDQNTFKHLPVTQNVLQPLLISQMWWARLFKLLKSNHFEWQHLLINERKIYAI